MSSSSLVAVETAAAPAPVGPYNQAVKAGGMVFCSGQIALNPDTQELVTGDIQAEADQVLKNLRAVLEAAGATLNDVVKTTVFLADMSDYVAVNEVYARYFSDSRPARAAVAVAGLPKGVSVEIDAVAVIDD